MFLVAIGFGSVIMWISKRLGDGTEYMLVLETNAERIGGSNPPSATKFDRRVGELAYPGDFLSSPWT